MNQFHWIVLWFFIMRSVCKKKSNVWLRIALGNSSIHFCNSHSPKRYSKQISTRSLSNNIGHLCFPGAMHVQKMLNKNIETIRELQVSNGCILVSNIVLLFGLNKLTLGFSPLFPLIGGKALFLPLFPPYPGKKEEKGSRDFPPQPCL